MKMPAKTVAVARKSKKKNKERENEVDKIVHQSARTFLSPLSSPDSEDLDEIACPHYCLDYAMMRLS